MVLPPVYAQPGIHSYAAAQEREEKYAQMRQLGQQYRDSRDPATRAAIAARLAATATTPGDPVLGRAAALFYANLGFFTDSLPVLAKARSLGHMTDNDYYADLARLFPLAPAASQDAILRELVAGQNGFSREILADMLRSRHLVSSLSPALAGQAALFLGKAGPPFPADVRRFGASDALRYDDWLVATVVLNARISGEPERAILARLLAVDGGDPRKLIAVLMSPEAGAWVRAALDRAAQEKVDAAIQAYARANAASAWIQEIADTARRNLSGR